MSMLTPGVLVILPVCWIVAGCGPQPHQPAQPHVEDLARQSQELADRFQKTLQTELQAAMASSGPAGAIDVCADRAPAIAQALSEESGAVVRRTAFRHRNPAGAPDEAEAAIMSQWLTQPFAADGQPRQAQVIGQSREGPTLLWMRAIPTGKQCLACHGPAGSIAPDVQAAISARYPRDRATGFAEGELRGALSIRWMAAATGPSER